MFLLNTDGHGKISRANLTSLGGVYPFPERLLRGGTGSPRLIYWSGLPEFDAARRGEREDIGFVSVEELRGGMVLRLNINQRITCVGTSNDRIESIRLLAYRMSVRTHSRLGPATRIVHFGELTVHTLDKPPVEIIVLVPDFSATLKYFSRSGWKDCFRHEVSDQPVVTGEGDFVLNYTSLLKLIRR